MSYTRSSARLSSEEPEKHLAASSRALVYVGADDPPRRAGPRAEGSKPAQRSAADVRGAPARSVAEPREELAPGGLPHLRLQPQALQPRGSLREQVALPRHPLPVSGRRPASARWLGLHGSASPRGALKRWRPRPSLPLRRRWER